MRFFVTIRQAAVRSTALALVLAAGSPAALAVDLIGGSAVVNPGDPPQSWNLSNSATLTVNPGGVTRDITALLSTLNMTGGTVSVAIGGNTGGGVVLRNGSAATIANSTITNTLERALALANSQGVPGSNLPAQATVTDSTLTGVRFGATVADGGVLTLSNTHVTGADGGNGGTLGGGTGLGIFDGVITVTNGSVVQGDKNGVLIANDSRFSGRIPELVLTVDASTVQGTTGSAIRIASLSASLPTNADITVQNGANLIGGNGVILEVADQFSSANFKANNTALVGDIVVAPGGSADVTLANHASLTGAMQNVTNVTLGPSGLWNITANSTVAQTTTNAGTIDFTPPAGGGFKTLTTGSYVGQNGTLGLNTVLGADGSASDKLVINGGTATGQSLLRITNAGGAGAETTGNGIQVVQAINGATTAANAFTLPGEVRAGAFDYRLFQGGVGGSNPNDWFLRSDFISGPGQILPIIGPEIATYGVVQPIARQLGMATLGTLHDRIGNTLTDPCVAADAGRAVVRKGYDKVPPPADGCAFGWSPAWGRAFGQQINNHYSSVADPRAEGDLVGFQAGVDLWRGALIAGHRDAAGFYLAYGNAHVDASGLVTNEAATGDVVRKTGTLNLDGWSGGVYWTHVGPTGWYVDTVVQGTRYQGAAMTQFARLPTVGSGIITSLEGGYPIALPAFGPGFVLEPQAQILWQRVEFDQKNDGLGDVALGSTSGATGRVGARAKWIIVTAGRQQGPQVWQPYLDVNLWRDWGAQATTTFGVDPVPLMEQATRLELAGGLSVKVNAHLSVFANAGYQFAVANTDGGKRDGVRGTGGFTLTW